MAKKKRMRWKANVQSSSPVGIGRLRIGSNKKIKRMGYCGFKVDRPVYSAALEEMINKALSK